MHCYFAFSSVLPPEKISVLAAALLRRVSYWLFAARIANSECVWRVE